MAKKNQKQLRSGEKFIAIDKKGRVYHYIFIGIDISDLEEGTGCQYIILKNLDMNSYANVEAAWFSEREIITE